MKEGTVEDGIRATFGTVTWMDLEGHAKRDGLLLVDPPLDIVEVALALAGDRTDQVQEWLESGALHKPTDALLLKVEESPAVSFHMVICQPWVVAQLLTH